MRALQRSKCAGDEVCVAIQLCVYMRVGDVAATVARCQNGAADAFVVGLEQGNVSLRACTTQRECRFHGGHQARCAATYDCDCFHAAIIRRSARAARRQCERFKGYAHCEGE